MLHSLSLGHFDPAAIAEGRLVVRGPLDMTRVMELLREFGESDAAGGFRLGGCKVQIRDGYVAWPWLMPLRNKSCEAFARRLAEETGCLIVDHRRLVSVDEFELDAGAVRLSERDRLLLRDGVYEPDAKPSYESVKSCLIWRDEIPDGLSAEGRTTILRLLAARSYMHRGIPLIGRLERLASIWNEAVASGLEWNGFRRTSISETDQSFLAKSIREEGEAGAI